MDLINFQKQGVGSSDAESKSQWFDCHTQYFGCLACSLMCFVQQHPSICPSEKDFINNTDDRLMGGFDSYLVS